jgi:orotate phosphoribosyltransferase
MILHQERLMHEVLDSLAARNGHFLLESGHHGSLWLDLETLCLKPERIDALANSLSAALSEANIETVCAPLVEGAFVGLMVALRLEVPFAYSERFVRSTGGDLFPAGYRVPGSLRDHLRGKRIAIVDDVINAGSAVRGTFEDVKLCGAEVVAIGALLVLGTAASQFAVEKNVPLMALGHATNDIWIPADCPLCAAGLPLEDVASFGPTLSI